MKAGNNGHPRGSLTTVSANEEVVHCNNLSKIFFRVSDPYSAKDYGAVYTSVIHTDNILCFSYQGNAFSNIENPINPNATNIRGLGSSNIDNIKNSLNAPPDLFISMIENGNNIAYGFFRHFLQDLRNKIQSESRDSASILECVFSLSRSYLNELDEKIKLTLKENKFFKTLAIDFFKILFENNALRDYMPKLISFANKEYKEYKVVPYKGNHDSNYGVHVEVKGVDHIIKTYPNQQFKIFNVGLAAIRNQPPFFDKSPGCCAGCSAEFTVMAGNGYTINRTGDYTTNTPAGNYKPSANVTINDENFKKFIEVLNDRGLQDFVKKLNNHNDNSNGQIFGKGLKRDNNITEEFWYEYSKKTVETLLNLRLKTIGSDNIKIVNPDYVFDGSESSAAKLSEDIVLIQADKIFVILNMYYKHWVGLVIEKNESTLDIYYLDSEQQEMPELLRNSLSKVFDNMYSELDTKIVEKIVQQQKYNNCGIELIENLIEMLAGYRLSQEDSLPVHSLLYEDTLNLSGQDSSYYADQS